MTNTTRRAVLGLAAGGAGWYALTQRDDGPTGGGGGDVTDPSNTLLIPGGEIISIQGGAVGPYDGIEWETDGVLEIEDGSGLTLEEVAA